MVQKFHLVLPDPVVLLPTALLGQFFLIKQLIFALFSHLLKGLFPTLSWLSNRSDNNLFFPDFELNFCTESALL